jgi:hypothetical protein
MALDAGLPAWLAKRENSFMFEYGAFYLVYLSALWWCTKPLSKYSSHFSYLPPQGFLYPAQLTAGILTKQLRMLNYRTFSPTLSIPIGGFLCQPGVHFRLWFTGPSAKTHVSGAILLSAMRFLHPFLDHRPQSPLYSLSVSHIRVIDPRTTLILAAILFS